MKSTGVGISTAIVGIIASGMVIFSLIIVGSIFSPVVAAGERSLEVTSLRLVPGQVPVNQPFDLEIALQASDPDSTVTHMAAVSYFRVLKNNKTLFTSDMYPVNARNGEVEAWVTHMNPVPASGIYTISVHVRSGQLTDEKRIELAIGQPRGVGGNSTNGKSVAISSPGANQTNMPRTEQIHLRHILLKQETDAYLIISGMNGLTGENLKDKFILEAKSNSVGPTGKNGGDLGMVKRGMMVAEFEEAAFRLSPGTITTSPIKTVYGYHIIYREQ